MSGMVSTLAAHGRGGRGRVQVLAAGCGSATLGVGGAIMKETCAGELGEARCSCGRSRS